MTTQHDTQHDGGHDGRHDGGGLRVELVGVRGGHGTSTVAAATALILGAAHGRVRLEAHDPDAVAALLGTPPPGGDGVGARVNAMVELAPTVGGSVDDGGPVVVVDLGTIAQMSAGATEQGPAVGAAGAVRVGVLRGPCYLGLRTLAAADTATWAGLVLVVEAGRALDARDVEDVAGLPVLATAEVTPAVARTLDAGLAPTRMPAMREFTRLRRWLAALTTGLSRASDPVAPDPFVFATEPVESTCTDWHLPPMAEGAEAEVVR